MIGYYLLVTFSGQFGLEHNLYKFGRNPVLIYSDMNGYGHFLTGIHWFNFYWGTLGFRDGLACHLFWVRGTDTAWRSRWKLANQRYRSWHGAMAIGLMVGIVATGGYIYYSTCILNPFRTSKSLTISSANYEKKYRHLKDEAQPRVTGVRVDFDSSQSLVSCIPKGEMTLKNKTSEPISKVYVEVPRDIPYTTLSLNGQTSSSVDKEYGLHTFELKEAIQPAATASCNLSFRWSPKGLPIARIETPW